MNTSRTLKLRVQTSLLSLFTSFLFLLSHVKNVFSVTEDCDVMQVSQEQDALTVHVSSELDAGFHRVLGLIIAPPSGQSV